MKGNEVPNAPEFTANAALTFEHEFNSGLDLMARIGICVSRRYVLPRCSGGGTRPGELSTQVPAVLFVVWRRVLKRPKLMPKALLT